MSYYSTPFPAQEALYTYIASAITTGSAGASLVGSVIIIQTIGGNMGFGASEVELINQITSGSLSVVAS